MIYLPTFSRHTVSQRLRFHQEKEDKYEEGQDVNVDMLMLLATNKNKTMVQTGTWKAPSPEEEKILVLES